VVLERFEADVRLGQAAQNFEEAASGNRHRPRGLDGGHRVWATRWRDWWHSASASRSAHQSGRSRAAFLLNGAPWTSSSSLSRSDLKTENYIELLLSW